MPSDLSRELSADRLGALRDYYLAQVNGQGDFEDIFGHIEWLTAEADAAEGLTEALTWWLDAPLDVDREHEKVRQVFEAALAKYREAQEPQAPDWTERTGLCSEADA